MRITNVELLNAIEKLDSRMESMEKRTAQLQNCLVGENMDNGLVKEFNILKSRFSILCGGITMLGVPLILYVIYQVIQDGI